MPTVYSFLKYFFLLGISLGLAKSRAQGQRNQDVFNLGAIAGLNIAELNTASQRNFLGISAGAIGYARLAERWQLATEILYSQNGEFIKPKFYPDVPLKKVRLNHVEVPVRFEFTFDQKRHKRKIKLSYLENKIGFGVAYTKLLNHAAQNEDGEDISDQIVYKPTYPIRKSITTPNGCTSAVIRHAIAAHDRPLATFCSFILAMLGFNR